MTAGPITLREGSVLDLPQVMAVMAGEGNLWVPPETSPFRLPELPEPMDLDKILEDGF